MDDRKQHWEHIYSTKQPNEVSWTQTLPKTSLDFIHGYHLPKNARIIDIGAGDSKLVDYLLQEGYEDITILDISETAINKAKQRLGEKSKKVKWIVSDVTQFQPTEKYDVWHDRAAFHFLTTPQEIEKYITIAARAVRGYMIISTFSNNGPKKCSGLDIRQYSEDQLQKELSKAFRKIKCLTEDHITPFNTTQNFLFCSFKRAIAA